MRCVARIEGARAATLDVLAHDIDRQDILTLNLTRAVQLCVDVATHVLTEKALSAPSTMGESFDELLNMGVIDEATRDRLRAAVGFRNIAVHSYRKISWEVVHRISYAAPDELRAFARQVLEFDQPPKP